MLQLDDSTMSVGGAARAAISPGRQPRLFPRHDGINDETDMNGTRLNAGWISRKTRGRRLS